MAEAVPFTFMQDTFLPRNKSSVGGGGGVRRPNVAACGRLSRRVPCYHTLRFFSLRRKLTRDIMKAVQHVKPWDLLFIWHITQAHGGKLRSLHSPKTRMEGENEELRKDERKAHRKKNDKISSGHMCAYDRLKTPRPSPARTFLWDMAGMRIGKFGTSRKQTRISPLLPPSPCSLEVPDTYLATAGPNASSSRTKKSRTLPELQNSDPSLVLQNSARVAADRYRTKEIRGYVCRVQIAVIDKRAPPSGWVYPVQNLCHGKRRNAPLPPPPEFLVPPARCLTPIAIDIRLRVFYLLPLQDPRFAPRDAILRKREEGPEGTGAITNRITKACLPALRSYRTLPCLIVAIGFGSKARQQLRRKIAFRSGFLFFSSIMRTALRWSKSDTTTSAYPG